MAVPVDVVEDTLFLGLRAEAGGEIACDSTTPACRTGSTFTLVTRFTATDNLNDVTTTNIGKWLPQTPREQVSAFADYTQRGGRFAGLGGNFGVRFVGANAADAANSFFIHNYGLLDAGLRFGYRHTIFSVNATNLTDKRYVATCTGLSACYYGYARNVIGTVKYQF